MSSGCTRPAPPLHLGPAPARPRRSSRARPGALRPEHQTALRGAGEDPSETARARRGRERGPATLRGSPRAVRIGRSTWSQAVRSPRGDPLAGVWCSTNNALGPGSWAGPGSWVGPGSCAVLPLQPGCHGRIWTRSAGSPERQYCVCVSAPLTDGALDPAMCLLAPPTTGPYVTPASPRTFVGPDARPWRRATCPLEPGGFTRSGCWRHKHGKSPRLTTRPPGRRLPRALTSR
jgi:hypothetical protein